MYLAHNPTKYTYRRGAIDKPCARSIFVRTTLKIGSIRCIFLINTAPKLCQLTTLADENLINWSDWKLFLFLSSIIIWTNLQNHWKRIPLLDSSGNNLDFLDPEQAFFHLGNIQIPRTYSADHNFCNLVSPHNLHLLGHRLVSRRLNNTQICTHYIQDRFITFEFYFMWCALIEQNIIPLTVYLHILNLDIHQNLDPGR